MNCYLLISYLIHFKVIQFTIETFPHEHREYARISLLDSEMIARCFWWAQWFVKKLKNNDIGFIVNYRHIRMRLNAKLFNHY